MIEAAAQVHATVVFPGNNYNYGNITEPVTEITPFNPNCNLGDLRVQIENQLEGAANTGMIQSLVIRLPEIWGPNVTNRSFAPVFENTLNNKPIPWLYATDIPQQMVWNIDAGRMIVRLMETDFEQPFETVHYSGNTVMTMDQFFETVKKEAGADVKTRVVGNQMIRFLSIFNPVIRKVKELEYKYRHTILLSGEKCNQLIPDFNETSLEEAVRETLH